MTATNTNNTKKVVANSEVVILEAIIVIISK